MATEMSAKMQSTGLVPTSLRFWRVLAFLAVSFRLVGGEQFTLCAGSGKEYRQKRE